jgi:hypothetical protein
VANARRWSGVESVCSKSIGLERAGEGGVPGGGGDAILQSVCKVSKGVCFWFWIDRNRRDFHTLSCGSMILKATNSKPCDSHLITNFSYFSNPPVSSPFPTISSKISKPSCQTTSTHCCALVFCAAHAPTYLGFKYLSVVLSE